MFPGRRLFGLCPAPFVPSSAHTGQGRPADLLLLLVLLFCSLFLLFCITCPPSFACLLVPQILPKLPPLPFCSRYATLPVVIPSLVPHYPVVDEIVDTVVDHIHYVGVPTI